MTTDVREPGSPAVPAVGRPARRRVAGLVAALVVTVVAAGLSVALGSRVVGLGDVVAAFTAHDPGDIAQAAVRERVPRTLLALVVGAALGTSGALLQGVTRNPLADPGILGISAGASLAVVVGIAFLGVTTAAQYVWLAILGAGLTAAFVYLVGSAGRGGATPFKLALAGAATAAALTSLISGVLLPRTEVMTVFRFWQVGGVGGATREGIVQVLPFLVVGAVLAAVSARGLNTLALGDELAAGLGVRVARARLVAALAGVLLCGAATAVAGPISFVGLVVPHLARLLVGVDHRWILPFSAVLGAALVTFADVLGRVVARPEDVEVGVLTALIGAPFFIAVARRSRMREL